MNRSFKILWFEDELTWYRMEHKRIASILAEHQLKDDIVRKNGNDFNLSELCDNSFDLILMDFKLASGATGDTIVTAIRRNNVLTDILFYSTEEDSMLDAIQRAKPPIDGIYYTKRDSDIFTEKARRLINKIVKRSEDLINLRGFVLDDSSDFELRIKEILNIAWQKFVNEEKEELETAAGEIIKVIMDRQQKNFKKVTQTSPVFPVAVNDIHFLSHTDRLHLLTIVITILQRKHGFQPKTEHTNFKINYENEISHYRNALGHKKSNESTIEITKGNFIPVDANLHQMMRQTLSRYDSLIQDIEKYITESI